jgi:hypothetical protein
LNLLNFIEGDITHQHWLHGEDPHQILRFQDNRLDLRVQFNKLIFKIRNSLRRFFGKSLSGSCGRFRVQHFTNTTRDDFYRSSGRVDGSEELRRTRRLTGIVRNIVVIGIYGFGSLTM